MVRVLSKCLVEIFGMYGKKGDIDVDFDVDFIVIDLNKEWKIIENNLKYLNKCFVFVGLKGKGVFVLIIICGKIVFKDGEILVDKVGYGNLIR